VGGAPLPETFGLFTTESATRGPSPQQRGGENGRSNCLIRQQPRDKTLDALGYA
jgi:hypothetical protein